MKTKNTEGALSLQDTLIEVMGWTPEFYQNIFNDALDQQPYILGTLMDADDGMDEQTHSLVLRSVIALKWAFQKMGWRQTMLSEEKWHQLIEDKIEAYEDFQEENGLDVEALIKMSSSPNTLSQLFLFVVEDHDADAEAQGNALFLLDCAVEAFEMAVLQDKSKSDA
jgi:hypothetical protein